MATEAILSFSPCLYSLCCFRRPAFTEKEPGDECEEDLHLQGGDPEVQQGYGSVVVTPDPAPATPDLTSSPALDAAPTEETKWSDLAAPFDKSQEEEEAVLNELDGHLASESVTSEDQPPAPPVTETPDTVVYVEPVRESPSGEALPEEIPATTGSPIIPESPARVSPARESPARESPARESPSRESPARESPARESPPPRESPSAVEQPAVELPAVTVEIEKDEAPAEAPAPPAVVEASAPEPVAVDVAPVEPTVTEQPVEPVVTVDPVAVEPVAVVPVAVEPVEATAPAAPVEAGVKEEPSKPVAEEKEEAIIPNGNSSVPLIMLTDPAEPPTTTTTAATAVPGALQSESAVFSDGDDLTGSTTNLSSFPATSTTSLDGGKKKKKSRFKKFKMKLGRKKNKDHGSGKDLSKSSPALVSEQDSGVASDHMSGMGDSVMSTTSIGSRYSASVVLANLDDRSDDEICKE